MSSCWVRCWATRRRVRSWRRRRASFQRVESLGRSAALETKPYDVFLEGLSESFRGGLRTARNRLGKYGAAVHVPAATTPVELREAFEQFLALEASGGTSGTRTAIALDPALRSFYGQLVERLGPTGALAVNVLVLERRPIAAQLTITSGRRCYVLEIASDKTHADLAPGNMLLERLLQQYGTHAEVRYIDLVSSAPWHRSWNPVVRDAHSHLVFRAQRARLARVERVARQGLHWRRLQRSVADCFRQARAGPDQSAPSRPSVASCAQRPPRQLVVAVVVARSSARYAPLAPATATRIGDAGARHRAPALLERSRSARSSAPA